MPGQLDRLERFLSRFEARLHDRTQGAALETLESVVTALELLAAHPQAGRRLPGALREVGWLSPQDLLACDAAGLARNLALVVGQCLTADRAEG